MLDQLFTNMINPFTIEGKTILITGASSGIGKTTAILCSQMGAKVIITGRNEKRLNETYDNLEGTGHDIIIGDLSNNAFIEELVEYVPALNGTVLCAGIATVKPVLYSLPEEYQTYFNVNFFSPIELLRQLVKKKKLVKGSSCVVIASIGGNYIWSPGNAIYGTTKAALKSAVNFFAVELAPKRIRVNSICPGMVDTPMIKNDAYSQEQVEADKALYPLGRYGKPEDIAYASIYLLSNASEWMTGNHLVIDGGVTTRQ